MKIIKASLITFYAFLYIKSAPVYGSGPNGCGPSKRYELKDDKSEPIKFRVLPVIFQSPLRTYLLREIE